MTTTCEVSHAGGHEVSSSLPVPTSSTGGMSDAQRFGAANTYRKRLSLVQVLGLAMGDPDVDGADVVSGAGRVGVERVEARMGQLVAYGPGDAITAEADARQESRSPNLDVLILGGQPIREPVAWSGPFVMNSHTELAQAFEDYRAGRPGTVPAHALERQ